MRSLFIVAAAVQYRLDVLLSPALGELKNSTRTVYLEKRSHGWR
jgi:hypothetical protein